MRIKKKKKIPGYNSADCTTLHVCAAHTGNEKQIVVYVCLWVCDWVCVCVCECVWVSGCVELCVVMTLGKSIEVPAVGMEEHLSGDSKVSETISHMG